MLRQLINILEKTLGVLSLDVQETFYIEGYLELSGNSDIRYVFSSAPKYLLYWNPFISLRNVGWPFPFTLIITLCPHLWIYL